MILNLDDALTKSRSEVKWESKAHIHALTGQMSDRFQNKNLFFSQKQWVISNQLSYEKAYRNENLYKCVMLHDQDDCHAHVW